MIDRLSLLEAIAQGPLVLDAAMGTRLIARGLVLAQDDPTLWNLSHPDEVERLHALDTAAGANALVSNTFGANRFWLDRLGRAPAAAEINHRAVAIARRIAGSRGFVLGSIGPTVVNWQGACREQAEWLADAGADAILLETFRRDQAGPALRELAKFSRLPILVSMYDWPNPIADAAKRLEGSGAAVLGVNCVPETVALEVIRRLAGATRLPLLAKPSGDPANRPETTLAEMLALGVRLAGGCCGTDESGVAAIRRACYDFARKKPLPARPCFEPSDLATPGPPREEGQDRAR